MPVSKNDLVFYLTSNDPFGEISDGSQSIGGYSVTAYSPTSATSGNVTLNGGSADLGLADGFAIVGSEIVQCSNGVIGRGALGTQTECHLSGDPVSQSQISLFNNALSPALEQFRCLAVQNTNQTEIFYDLQFYVRYDSITSNTSIEMGLEIPSADYTTGSADSGTIISLTDSIITTFIDNYFANCILTITSGDNINQSRIIISSDQASGTAVVDSAFPLSINPGDTYTISNSPSQRLKSGTKTPANVSFRGSINLTNALGIDAFNNRTNGSDLLPNETIYLWLKRSRISNSPASLSNRFVISAHYGIS